VNYEIKQGDCLEVLKTLPSESVNCCITSPPYWGLRDYGTAKWEGGNENCEHTISHYSDNLKPDCDRPVRGDRSLCIKCGAKRIDSQIGLELTPESYVQKMVDVFREVRRVLMGDGTLWLNLGDSYSKNESNNGGYSSKSTLSGFTSPNTKGRVSCDSGVRHKIDSGLKPKDLCGIPWRVAFALQADGWYLRQDIIWHKPNPMPESVTDRCTKAHEYIFLMTKKPNYYFNNEAMREPGVMPAGTKGARGSTERQGQKGVNARPPEYKIYDGFRNRRSVWSVTVKPYKEAHFATFPKELIEPCVLAGCPKDGTILDPFGGSGTTAEVAIQNGRNALLIELNPEYIELAKTRISNTQSNLFC
jgi:DNA modification methylase